MANFREGKEALLLAHDGNIITAEEYFLLNDLNTSENLHFPYWLHDSFAFFAECQSEFRFYSDIYRLADVF